MDIDFISVECLEKLGLEQNPFIDHARDPFLYIDNQLEMSMNVLIDYLLNQNSTIILFGETGVGKTTHLRLLLRKGYQKFNFCTLRAKPKTTFSEIEQKIKERWRLTHHIEEEGKDKENLTALEHIKEYIEDDKNPVLIIDDAHRLQNNVLDELLKLKHHVGLQSERTLGLVLASEPSMQTQLSELEQTNPAATQIYQVNVRSFDATQCEEYIRYRLEKAGSSSDDVFSTAKITEIYTRSKGLPKHINKIAREELSHLCEKPSSATIAPSKLQSSPGMRLGIILAGLIGLVVILSAVFKSTNETDEPIALDISKQEQPGLKSDTADKIDNKNQSTAEPKSEPVELKKDTSKMIAKPYVAPLVLGPLQKNGSDENIEKKSTKITDNKDTEKKKTTSADSKGTSQYTKFSSEWLLQQNPDSYTIQIVASPNEENLINFINKNALKDNTVYYQKTSADKTWYVLVHGIYPSRKDAINDIEQLSETLKKNKPYPVQIKYLQEIIRKP